MISWIPILLLLDVNVLVHAHQLESPDHRGNAAWLSRMLATSEPFAVPTAVVTGFLRVVTNPSIWKPPSTLDAALRFLGGLRRQPGWIAAEAATRHWELFEQCCRASSATGNLIHDAHLAALAMEHGAEIVSADKDFARFPSLRWRRPLA